MRHATILVLSALALAIALPQQSSARPRGFPGALFGIITAPIDKILGATRRIGRGPPPRRSQASRPRPPAPVASTPRPASRTESASRPAAPAAAAATAATATGAAVAVGAVGATDASASAAAGVQPTPLPQPAPPQRSVSLTTPADDIQKRSDDTSRKSARPAREAAPSLPNKPMHLGAAGPAVWPAAYEDVVGFVFWPAEFSERLRGHGIGDVLNVMFTPPTAGKAKVARAAGDGAAASNAASAGTAGFCGDAAAQPTGWPATQIEQSIKLNEEQRGKLDELKAAIGAAVATIRAACRDEPSLPPLERLRALQNMLWAVHDAATAIRRPLASFYDSLSDEQKRPFLAAASAAPKIDLQAMASGGSGANQAALARMCGMPSPNNSLMRQIEQYLQPTKAQRASLETLQKKAFEMGQFLMASCLQPVSPTPVERLDSAMARLTAMIFAASNVSLAFNDFYNQLDERQLAKISTLGQ
jgi:hypothetical protein